MDETLQELERQYCPPLDTALFQAIVCDYDCHDKAALENVRTTLDVLKASAEAEEATGFDPSGSSNNKDVLSDHDAERGLSPSESTETSMTDFTGSFSAFTFDDDKDVYDKGIDAMTDEEKCSLLGKMFSDLKPSIIQSEMKKQKGDFGRIVEILLNHDFLAHANDEDGFAYQAPKGIDGFAAESSTGRSKKGRTKKKRKAGAAQVDPASKLVDGAAASVNRWQVAQDGVKFISDRLNLPTKTVSSIYNASGHSQRATIIAICKKDPLKDFACDTDPEDPHVQSSIVDLRNEFPAIELPHIRSLITLTHPLFVSAREIAQVILDPVAETIVPQYAATKLDAQSVPTSALLDAEDNDLLAYTDSSILPVNTSFDTLRSNAFAAASAAYRKSRSQPLMGGAAAYYASIGHTANAALKRSRAIEANSRVAAQSNADGGMCDLHGVTVADANRIAKQYVERWWEGRREWAREGSIGEVFRLVVGRGVHSEAGKAKLGPAVAKMLKAEGWRVDEQVGELIVRGRARK